MGDSVAQALVQLGQHIQAADTLVFRWVNGACAHPVLDVAMVLFTELGLGVVQLALLALLYVFGGPTGRRTALLCALAFAVSGLAAQILKVGVERPRPGFLLEDCRFLSERLFHGSFPSGHTTTSFAIALVAAAHYRRWAVPLFLGAALVGCSRVYLGVHFPTDVLAGAATGLASGWACLAEVRRARPPAVAPVAGGHTEAPPETADELVTSGPR